MRGQPTDYESDQIKHSDGEDEKKQEAQSSRGGELFTFWKLESASNREPEPPRL